MAILGMAIFFKITVRKLRGNVNSPTAARSRGYIGSRFNEVDGRLSHFFVHLGAFGSHGIGNLSLGDIPRQRGVDLSHRGARLNRIRRHAEFPNFFWRFLEWNLCDIYDRIADYPFATSKRVEKLRQSSKVVDF